MRKRKGIVFWAMTLFVMNGCFLWGFQSFKETRLERIEEYKREIRVINLVNGLDLTRNQMEMILRSAEECQRLREDFKATHLSRQAQWEGLLEEIKSHLWENNEIPRETARSFHQIEKEMRKTRLEIEERIQDLAKDIEKSLGSHQLYQLESFIPCVIPPKGESRIGQANDYKGLTRSLERIRRIPHTIYQSKKGLILKKTLEGLKLKFPRSVDVNSRETRKHILVIYDEARNMDEAEFEIEKGELAERLISHFKPQNPKINLTRRITGFILSDEVIPIVKQRLEKK